MTSVIPRVHSACSWFSPMVKYIFLTHHQTNNSTASHVSIRSVVLIKGVREQFMESFLNMRKCKSQVSIHKVVKCCINGKWLWANLPKVNHTIAWSSEWNQYTLKNLPCYKSVTLFLPMKCPRIERLLLRQETFPFPEDP